MGSARIRGGSRHLRFVELPLRKGCKLHEYNVINDDFDEEIGVIHWRGGWRQYVFMAKPEIDMCRGCMNEVNKFIDKLMSEWRDKR